MTRQEITNEGYTVNERGIIRDPGKFEGEPLYVPAFWDSGLYGCADIDAGACFGFRLSAEDKQEWPELADVFALWLSESESGFVYCSFVDNEAELSALEEEASEYSDSY